MRYVGGKFRQSKHYAPIINDLRDGRPYLEPFLGSGVVMEKVQGGIRIGSDSNRYLIALLQAIQDGWIPPEFISEDEYKAVKADYSLLADMPWAVAFIGIGCSLGGNWFNTYARDPSGRVNFAAQLKRTLLKQKPLLAGVELRCKSYTSYFKPEGMMIYVDPPYYPKSYNYLDRTFNHALFWGIVQDWARRNTVVASFYGDIPLKATVLHEMNSKGRFGHHDTSQFPDVSERLYLISPP